MARARALLAQPFSAGRRPGRAGAAGDPRARRQPALLHRPEERAARVWEIEFRPEREAEDSRADGGARSPSTTSRSRWNTTRCSPGCSSTPRSSRWTARRRSTSPIPPAWCAARSSRTATRTVRIALNGAQSHRTLSGRFLSEFFGSGVQHIAFASADIFASAERLAGERHRSCSPIPDNYYDDLEARFGLAPELLDRLQSIAACSTTATSTASISSSTPQPFADRFFFEIVERRNGYRGYGAANAPIRLAAQARVSAQAAGSLSAALKEQHGSREYLVWPNSDDRLISLLRSTALSGRAASGRDHIG